MDINTNDPFTLAKGKIILSSSSQALSTSATTDTPQIQNHKKTKFFQFTNRFQILSPYVETGLDPTSF